MLAKKLLFLKYLIEHFKTLVIEIITFRSKNKDSKDQYFALFYLNRHM